MAFLIKSKVNKKREKAFQRSCELICFTTTVKVIKYAFSLVKQHIKQNKYSISSIGRDQNAFFYRPVPKTIVRE